MSLYTRDKRQTELNTSYKLVLKINYDGTPQKKKRKNKKKKWRRRRKIRRGRGGGEGGGGEENIFSTSLPHL